jgi:hypothetical protein
MKKITRTKLEKDLDELWRKGGVAYCEICNSLPKDQRINYTKLDNHHIVGRKNKVLRWDLRNRLKVCSYHHTMGGANNIVQDNLGGWFLNWKAESDWMGINRKEDKEYLREKHQIPYKQWTMQELQEMIIYLKGQL